MMTIPTRFVKSILLVVVISVLLVSLVSAVWWNPFTWSFFQKQDVRLSPVCETIEHSCYDDFNGQVDSCRAYEGQGCSYNDDDSSCSGTYTTEECTDVVDDPGSPPEEPVASTCEDSDGGLNYYVQGTGDYCGVSDEGPVVFEHSCNTDESILITKYACSNGCVDGACVIVATPNLINVDFGGSAGAYTGSAVIGSAGDYWNGGNSGTLQYADSSASSISLNTVGLSGAWGGSFGVALDYGRVMMNSYAYGSQVSAAVVLSGVPAGVYELYLYGHGDASGQVGTYAVQGVGKSTSSSSSSCDVFSCTHWQEGLQFVKYTNVTVGSSGTLVVNISRVSYGPMINGLQLVPASSPNGGGSGGGSRIVQLGEWANISEFIQLNATVSLQVRFMVNASMNFTSDYVELIRYVNGTSMNVFPVAIITAEGIGRVSDGVGTFYTLEYRGASTLPASAMQVRLTLVPVMCTDSDGGLNYGVKGITSGMSVFPEEGFTSKADTCIQKNSDGTFRLNYSLRDPNLAGAVSSCVENPNNAFSDCAVYEYFCSYDTIVGNIPACSNGCQEGACMYALGENITARINDTVWVHAISEPISFRPLFTSVDTARFVVDGDVSPALGEGTSIVFGGLSIYLAQASESTVTFVVRDIATTFVHGCAELTDEVKGVIQQQFSNATGTWVDRDGEVLHLVQTDKVNESEYIILGNDVDVGVYEITEIQNSSSGFDTDVVEVREIVAGNVGNTYSATLTSEGNGNITIKGIIYGLKYTGASSTPGDARQIQFTPPYTPRGYVGCSLEPSQVCYDLIEKVKNPMSLHNGDGQYTLQWNDTYVSTAWVSDGRFATQEPFTGYSVAWTWNKDTAGDPSSIDDINYYYTNYDIWVFNNTLVNLSAYLALQLDKAVCKQASVWKSSVGQQTYYICNWNALNNEQDIDNFRETNRQIYWYDDNVLVNIYLYYGLPLSDADVDRLSHQAVRDFLGQLQNNEYQFTDWDNFALDWPVNREIVDSFDLCKSDISNTHTYDPECKTEPLICPEYGYQTRICRTWNEQTRDYDVDEQSIYCSPGICSGCYTPRWFGYDNGDNVCVPYGTRLAQQGGKDTDEILEGINMENVNDYFNLTIYNDQEAQLTYTHDNQIMYDMMLRVGSIHTIDLNGEIQFEVVAIVPNASSDRGRGYVTVSVVDNFNAYCNYNGNLLEQKGDDTSCQNNYECASNVCSAGSCVPVTRLIEQSSALRDFIVRALCRLNPFDDMTYTECVANYLG